MTQAKHTPAPWIYDEENDGGIYSRTGAYVGAAVKLGTDEGDANARLMAAAPELLSALQVVAALETEPGVIFTGRELTNAVAIAREAIAKATGGAA